MSNIYIQEPPTSGKVLLTTTVGEIEVELWSRETPKACRNFVQLCMEGYYEGTIFHRVVKNFIVQGGDPTGTGEGGESIYDEPFKDEIHSRLRFNRRGLVAMANAGKHDNGSQFFFTLGNTPELQNLHTIFGKVVGDTLFNMLKLGDVATGNDERPLFPHKIIKTEVLNNPFPDIVPRERKRVADRKKEKPQAVAVKNFKLLSFGDEAEEDEEEVTVENKKYEGKSKSTQHANELEKDEDGEDGPLLEDDVRDEEPKPEEEAEEIDNEKFLSYVQNKLRGNSGKASSLADVRSRIKHKDPSEKKDKPKKEKKPKNETQEEQKEEKQESVVKKEYMDEISVYAEMKKNLPKKGKSREAQTLEMLGKFKQKMEKLKYGDDEQKKEAKDADWMMHTFQSDGPRTIAKDANMKDGDWYDITDPRNTLNKRRREDGLGKIAKKNKIDLDAVVLGK